MKQYGEFLAAVAKSSVDSPWVKTLAAIAGALLGYMFQSEAETKAVIALGFMIVLDTVAGLVVAWQEGEEITRDGFARVLVKVFAYGAVISVVSTMRQTAPVPTSVTTTIVTGVLFLCVSTEMISILRNVGRMKVIPTRVLKAIRRLLNLPNDIKPDSNDKQLSR